MKLRAFERYISLKIKTCIMCLNNIDIVLYSMAVLNALAHLIFVLSHICNYKSSLDVYGGLFSSQIVGMPRHVHPSYCLEASSECSVESEPSLFDNGIRTKVAGAG